MIRLTSPRIVDLAVSAGFYPADVMIALAENRPVDWSLSRGLSFGDCHAPIEAGPAATAVR